MSKCHCLLGFLRYLGMLGLEPGLEFKVAMEEANKLGAKVVYGDRSDKETLSKLSKTLTFSQVLNMLSSSGPQVGPRQWCGKKHSSFSLLLTSLYS